MSLKILDEALDGMIKRLRGDNMNEINQKVEEMSNTIHLSCDFCDNTYETDDEEGLWWDDMSGSWAKPCGKCKHTMWEEEE